MNVHICAYMFIKYNIDQDMLGVYICIYHYICVYLHISYI